MNILGVIPARYASTRLEGKPLADILGKPMVVRVYERAVQSSLLNEVLVATDDERIMDACKKFNMPSVMTGIHHQSGTDRIFEAVSDKAADIIVNIQGDEPLLDPDMLDTLISPLTQIDKDIPAVSSLYCRITDEPEYKDPNSVKVVLSDNRKALYFSRASIPFGRDTAMPERVYKHMGFYAYNRKALERFVNLGQSYLEKTEKLEQLRFIEAGIPIYMSEVKENTLSVDTPEDLERVIDVYRKL